MLPVLAAAAIMLIALPLSAYAIQHASDHGHDVRDAVLLLLVLGGLAAALGMATFYPDWMMGRAAQPELQGIRV
ncbi:hypothetical protein [Methylobacterium sp. J-070]|uniref:hypothetical protein n=1 Tax=Methylobacterium sp. J-070 TaxID=2836650 RepID=UPI001FBB9268|nr:hypothetical protein [Methylobacterium sp. J-070]MCJ2052096.1 hypothetical protein [Methylobacterium sp. J-070]